MVSDRVTWGLENAGRTILFDPKVPKDYLKAAGASGMGVAPTALSITASVGGGGKFRRSQRLSRLIVFPVVTYGTDRADVERKLRALVRAFDDTYTTPYLVATYPDGTVFDTEVHYSGGADHQWGSGDTDGETYCRWVLQFTAPNPYFTARAQTPVTVGNTGGRGLLKGGSLSKLRVTSSQALGSVTITNPGDVETWPTWQIRGPGTSFTAVRAIDGASFNLVTPFGSGNPVTIDTKAKTVLDAANVDRYDGMVGAPKLFSLPPGTSTVNVNLLGADATSLVTMSFAERRELIF